MPFSIQSKIALWRAKRARRANQHQKAITLLQNELEKQPQSSPLLKALSLSYFAQGENKAAIDTLALVTGTHPLGPHTKTIQAKATERFMSAELRRAADYKKRKEFKKAADILTQLWATVGDRSEVLTQLATTHFQLGNNTETIAYFDRAHAVSALGPNSLLFKARAHLRLRQPQLALEILQPLKQHPKVPMATFLHLAQAYHRTGDQDSALETLEHLKIHCQTDVKARIMLANGFSDIGAHDQALEAFAYCDREGLLNKTTRLSYARSALRSREFLKAETILLGDFSDETSAVARLFMLHEAQFKAKKRDAAEETAQRLSKLAGQSGDDWVKIGKTQRNLGLIAAARRSFQAAAEMGANAQSIAMDMAECDLKAGVLNRAAEVLNKCLEDNPTSPRSHFILARVLVRQGQYDAAEHHFRQVIELNPEQASAYRELAMISGLGNQPGEAMSLLEKAHELEPHSDSISTELAAVYLEKGRYKDARRLAEDALSIDPEKINAKMIIANLALFAADSTPLSVTICATAPSFSDAEAWREFADDIEIYTFGPAGLREAINHADGMWIILDSPNIDADARREICNRLRGATGAVLRDGATIVAISTRFARDAITAYLSSTADTEVSDEDLHRFLCERGREIFPRLREETSQGLSSLENLGGEVFLISSSGHTLFGGAEHFLRGMAQLYRKLGFTPVIIGHRGSEYEEGITPDGIPFIQLKEEASEALRNLILRRAPALLHIVTGSGPFVLRQAQDLKVPVVYGTHFWREMLQGQGWFPDIDQDPAPKTEFKSLLIRNEAVYANSVYTRDMQYEQHELTSEVLYSLPSNITQPAKRDGRDCVLLVNARPEKGFDLLLKVAARCPNISFVVIASQSAKEEARLAILHANVQNVDLIDHVADMSAVYRRAWCVMVPSYRFVETFSRVVIEAHRFSVPVIGSDRGNVPLLLAQSGVTLSEDPELWAKELTHLHEDTEYWEMRSAKAAENSERYPFAPQQQVLERLVRQAKRPILVAVGNGIGNIIQCTPAIRRLSEYLKQPVDVVINQDFPGCEWLFADSPYVGMVFGSDTPYVRRQYELVIVLASFGKAVPRFDAKKISIARNNIPFEATEHMHESKYNLECVAAANIGFSYAKEDISRYFVRNHTPTGLESNRIVLHAGGKPGEWEVKRWPFFTELATKLLDRGWEVISTGMPHEYIDGTVDRTGTPLAETLHTIGNAAYMIANDSGLMHVADGIGVPLTALFAPTSVTKNGPLSPTSKVIAPQKDCVPCQFTAMFKNCTCIGDITLDDVLTQVLSHLEQIGTGTASGHPKGTVALNI